MGISGTLNNLLNRSYTRATHYILSTAHSTGYRTLHKTQTTVRTALHTAMKRYCTFTAPLQKPFLQCFFVMQYFTSFPLSGCNLSTTHCNVPPARNVQSVVWTPRVQYQSCQHLSTE